MSSIITLLNDSWENRSTAVLALVCGLAAGIGGLFANTVLPHIVESTAVHGILGALSAGLAVIMGTVLFAIIDHW
jgi:hypothetical protein